MVRQFNADQTPLYQDYARLGKRLAESAVSYKEKWDTVVQQGLWKLCVPKQYGGNELAWQMCMIAIEGLASYYNDVEFITMLATQAGVLYIISRQGTEEQKARYLPLLIEGRIAAVVMTEFASKLVPIQAHATLANYLNNSESYVLDADMIILITHILMPSNKNKIIFFMIEKNKPGTGKRAAKHKPVVAVEEIFNNVNISVKDIFFPLEKSDGILDDFFSFEKLLYGVLTAGLALSFVKKWEKISGQYSGGELILMTDGENDNKLL